MLDLIFVFILGFFVGIIIDFISYINHTKINIKNIPNYIIIYIYIKGLLKKKKNKRKKIKKPIIEIITGLMFLLFYVINKDFFLSFILFSILLILSIQDYKNKLVNSIYLILLIVFSLFINNSNTTILDSILILINPEYILFLKSEFNYFYILLNNLLNGSLVLGIFQLINLLFILIRNKTAIHIGDFPIIFFIGVYFSFYDALLIINYSIILSGFVMFFLNKKEIYLIPFLLLFILIFNINIYL